MDVAARRKLRAIAISLTLIVTLFILNFAAMRFLPLERAGLVFGIINVDLALLLAFAHFLRPLFSVPSDFIVDGKRCPPNQPIVLRQPDSNEFVGRDQVLSALQEAYDSTDEAQCRIRVLVGPFGVGKTRIAQEFAQRVERAGAEVWWVTSSDDRTLRCSMCQVALNLGIPREDLTQSNCVAQKVLPRIIHHYRGVGKRWLLVIDNADDLRTLGTLTERRQGLGWVSYPGAAGMIIVTSRDADNRAWNGATTKLHRVQRLRPELGERMFESLTLRGLDSSRLGTRAEAATLARRLGYLPVGLRVVGDYFADISRHDIAAHDDNLPSTFTQYGARLESGEGILGPLPIDVTIEDSDRDTLYKCWDISLQLLESEGLTAARRLLAALARVRSGAINGQVVDTSLFSGDPEFRALTDPVILNRTLSRLRNLGLIERSRNAGGTWISVPPITRELARVDPKVARAANTVLKVTYEIEVRISALPS